MDRIAEFVAEYVGDYSPYAEEWWELEELRLQQIADGYIDFLGVRIARSAGVGMSIDDIVSSQPMTVFPVPEPIEITQEMIDHANSYDVIGMHQSISAGGRLRDGEVEYRDVEFTEYSYVMTPADSGELRGTGLLEHTVEAEHTGLRGESSQQFADRLNRESGFIHRTIHPPVPPEHIEIDFVIPNENQ